jgi:hypothetical protein
VAAAKGVISVALRQKMASAKMGALAYGGRHHRRRAWRGSGNNVAALENAENIQRR